MSAIRHLVVIAVAGMTGSALAQYNPAGPQTNVPVATVTSGGWTQCYSDAYSNSATTLATIQASCSQAFLMMACRATGSPTLQLLAQAPRADVLFDTGTGTSSVHTANGVDWYYNGSYSWGFAPQGATVFRSSCDIGDDPANFTTPDPLRLCWHTSAGNINGGWRCGTAGNLNSSTAFERIVYQANTVPVTLQRISVE